MLCCQRSEGAVPDLVLAGVVTLAMPDLPRNRIYTHRALTALNEGDTFARETRPAVALPSTKVTFEMREAKIHGKDERPEGHAPEAPSGAGSCHKKRNHNDGRTGVTIHPGNG